MKVLATSRVRLDVYGEHEYALPPMAVPPPAESYVLEELARYEGIQLFVARVRQHQPGFEPTSETAAAVAETADAWRGCRWRWNWRPHGRARCRLPS